MLKHFRLFVYESSNNLKFVCIMSKTTMKVLYEIAKAILYALGGFFGGNALM